MLSDYDTVVDFEFEKDHVTINFIEIELILNSDGTYNIVYYDEDKKERVRE